MQKFPKIIYKYFRVNEFLYNLFINSELWFSNPIDFNDPYDCNVAFKNKYNKDEFISFLKKSKSTTGEEITDEIINDRFKDYLNNPEKIGDLIIPPLKEMIDSKGVCCFSAEPKSLLMWGHYADSYKGICIGFDTDVLLKQNNIMDWVKYDKSFPVINFLTDHNLAITKIIWHKASE